MGKRVLTAALAGVAFILAAPAAAQGQPGPEVPVTIAAGKTKAAAREAPAVEPYDGETVSVPLIRLAFARSGDKGDSANIGVSRVVGITHVVSRPTGGLIAGQAALINLAGFTAPAMAVVPRVAMVMQLPGAGGGGGFGRRKDSNNGSLLVRNIPLDCR